MKVEAKADSANKKLTNIYAFLKQHRKYNKRLYELDYKACLAPYEGTNEKAYALLFTILNTQSQLKLDKAHSFFFSLSASRKNLSSFSSFLTFLNKGEKADLTYKNLHRLLSSQPGWGDKTAALFVKAIYNTHCGFAQDLAFWKDVPQCDITVNNFYVPVDEVIKYIFTSLRVPCSNNFKGINNYLAQHFSECSPIVWDELWYWGYITQKSALVDNKSKRKAARFNEAKYWNHLNTCKKKKTIEEVKTLSAKFYKLAY